MGRGLFSGIIWGTLVAVLSLWLLSQVGGMVGLLSTPEGIATTAPETKLDGGDAQIDTTPLEPEISETLPNDLPRESAELTTAESEPTPAPETAPVPAPKTTEIVVAPTDPDLGAIPAVPGQSNDANPMPPVSGQLRVPGADALPEIPPAAPPVEQVGAAEIVTQPPEVSESPAQPQTDTDPSPAQTDEPDQPDAPVAGEAPGGDFTPPVVVPTPEVSDPAPNSEPEQSTAALDQPTAPVPNSSTLEGEGNTDPSPAQTGEPDQPDTPVAEVAPGGDFTSPVVVPTPEVSDPAPNSEPEQNTAALDQPTAPVPNSSVLDGDGSLESAAPLEDQASNVRTHRLPTIGGSGSSPSVSPQSVGAQPAESLASGLAIRQFAQAFEAPDNRPLMAILLLPGDQGNETEVTNLPFPVSYVVDASQDDAAQKMTGIRSQGLEVVAMMPLPDRASPQDVETAFQTYLNRVPEAVAAMDTDRAGFQSGRQVATQVAQILAATGQGMITYSKGLNSAPQIAEREGVPAALVFRVFDGAGQDGAAIKRFLDQAAFRAGQHSGVILVGHNRPETIRALTEWSLGNRASTVAIAPVSTVLLAQ